MMNYGIDPIRYKRDIHEILKDAYEGLYREETLTKAEGVFKKISYRFRWAVHAQLFRKYSLESANAYDQNFGGTDGGIHPDAISHYFDAFEAYPARALKYLREGRLFEEALIPESGPSYDFDEGRLLPKREILLKALSEFDPVWERDKTAKAYEALSAAGTRAQRQDAAERLFAINRGALLKNGIRLPVEFKFEEPLFRVEGILKRASRAAGLVSSRLNSPRYTLIFAQEHSAEPASEPLVRRGSPPAGEGYVSCELIDGGRGITVWKQSLPSPGHKRREKAAFARALREGIFNAF
jgi:hypothetical protein